MIPQQRVACFWPVNCVNKPGSVASPRGLVKSRANGGIEARNQARVLQEVAQAKKRFGLPETAPVVRGHAAGRAGVWWHRFLQAQGITNHGGDSSSIAVNRRQRRATSDGLDVRTLLRMLMRYAHGAREGWRVGHVPSVEAEDRRHLHWDVATLKRERARTTTRLKG
jgi:hypothetical protein